MRGSPIPRTDLSALAQRCLQGVDAVLPPHKFAMPGELPQDGQQPGICLLLNKTCPGVTTNICHGTIDEYHAVTEPSGCRAELIDSKTVGDETFVRYCYPDAFRAAEVVKWMLQQNILAGREVYEFAYDRGPDGVDNLKRETRFVARRVYAPSGPEAVVFLREHVRTLMDVPHAWCILELSHATDAYRTRDNAKVPWYDVAITCHSVDVASMLVTKLEGTLLVHSSYTTPKPSPAPTAATVLSPLSTKTCPLCLESHPRSRDHNCGYVLISIEHSDHPISLALLANLKRALGATFAAHGVAFVEKLKKPNRHATLRAPRLADHGLERILERYRCGGHLTAYFLTTDPKAPHFCRCVRCGFRQALAAGVGEHSVQWHTPNDTQRCPAANFALRGLPRWTDKDKFHPPHLFPIPTPPHRRTPHRLLHRPATYDSCRIPHLLTAPKASQTTTLQERRSNAPRSPR
jgi:hypothetical protein